MVFRFLAERRCPLPNSLPAVLLALLPLAAGCQDGGADGATASAEAASAADAKAAEADQPAELEPADLGSVEQAHRAGDLYLAGQPSEDDIARWARKGYKTVVNLRSTAEMDELGWDEGRTVRVAGMDYIEVPFRSADELTDDMFYQVRKLLRDPTRRPLVLHCASSNRVGAVWLPYRVLDEGVPMDDALDDAARAGLRSSDLAAKARDYIRRKQE